MPGLPMPSEPSLRDRLHYIRTGFNYWAEGYDFTQSLNDAQDMFAAATEEDLNQQAAAWDAQKQREDEYHAEMDGYLDAEAGIGPGMDYTAYGK